MEVTREVEVEVTREVEVTKIVNVPVTVTHTPTPVNSPTPSLTPTPTNTATPTQTPTFTPTPNMTQTQRAIIDATQGADATATQRARRAKATEMAQYETIDRRELKTYPEQHKGEKIRVKGRIFNVNGNQELQMYIGWSYDAAYIVMREPFSGIYENDWIMVYGEIAGERCGENALGAEICQPLLKDAFFVKQ